MYHPMIDANDAELQAGQELVRAAGAAKLAKEKAEAEARERQAQAAVDAELRQAEAKALTLYSELRPLYERRARAARELSKPLAEFMQTETELRNRLEVIADTLAPLRVRTIPVEYKRHVDSLRASAGVPLDHTQIEAGGDLASTVARGLIRGHIGSGWIRAGKFTANLK